MNEILILLLPVIIASLVIFAISLFIFLKSNTSVLVKFMLVPIALSISVFMPMTLTTFLGKAMPVSEMPEKAAVLSHKTVILDGKKTKIEIWIAESTSTRLLVIPFSKNLEKALKEAQRGREAGNITELQRRPGKNKSKQIGDESEYELKMVPQINEMPPKD
jgi:hypothetical protein